MGRATSDPRANESARQPQGNLGAVPASHAGGRPRTCIPPGISPPTESRVSNGGVGLPPVIGWGSLERTACPSSPGGPPEAERARLLRWRAGSGLQACLGGGSSTTHVCPCVGRSLGVGTGELRRGSGTSGMRTFGQRMGSHNGAALRAGRPAEEGPVGAGGGAVRSFLWGVDVPTEGLEGTGHRGGLGSANSHGRMGAGVSLACSGARWQGWLGVCDVRPNAQVRCKASVSGKPACPKQLEKSGVYHFAPKVVVRAPQVVEAKALLNQDCADKPGEHQKFLRQRRMPCARGSGHVGWPWLP
ncbi:hypothetical protein K439DRAFT_1613966 [Ramaria rubella]|nr:hypothetical protein K439DRAFT_1613966 [Ramaria rubella]